MSSILTSYWFVFRRSISLSLSLGPIYRSAHQGLHSLQDLLLKSTTLKSKANTLFLTSPSSNTSTSSALSTYLSAIKILPPRGPPAPPSENRVPVIGTSSSNDNGGVQIEEITEEEAERIERGETEEERKRKELSGKIRDLRGVCWANVGACYMKMVSLSRRATMLEL